MDGDKLRAADYLELSQTPSPHEGQAGGDPTDSSRQQPIIPPPTTSHPTEPTPDRQPLTPDVPPRQKSLLPTCYLRESDMYARYAELLKSVSRFFRNEIKDVDHAWPPAQPPTFPPANPKAGPPLNRVFRDTHKESRSFSRYNDGQAGLKPDLCLLIESGDKPNEFEEKPEGSGGKPKVAPHWKDVLVPIEVKKEKSMDMSALVQMAQYAGSVMLEQFDRNFVITVLITGTTCRVFHWDVVGAQVTKAFDTCSMSFIQVMGRLATMTPSELGYDTHFSNAGRVRSTEIEQIKTHLMIHLSKPRPFFDHDTTSSTQCLKYGHSLVVDLQNMQFESKGLLFNRATRVWRAVAVNDPPPGEECQWSKETTYIVKQNWADDRRPNEGFFHHMAKGVKTVPELVGMEEREFTSSFRALIDESDRIGVLSLVETKHIEGIALKNPSLLGVDASPPSNHAGTDVGDADVSGRGEGMSVDAVGDDDVGGGAARDKDEGVDGDLSAAGVGEEDDGGHNEDVADQKVASNVDMRDMDANSAKEKRPLERVLLRFVFGREGRPLGKARDSIELLEATVQWIDGLIQLDCCGIIHRDISYGNLLLPASKVGDGVGQASIIDLGLSHYKTPEEIVTQAAGEASGSSQDYDGAMQKTSQPHHHLTARKTSILSYLFFLMQFFLCAGYFAICVPQAAREL
ncbi:hypothetical protein FRC01_009554 [Tulasnella sp. 417]|nr:hypothetical protein FRC01_009554 [Tulasnella sp. 417]